jgi:hypothetical protein
VIEIFAWGLLSARSKGSLGVVTLPAVSARCQRPKNGQAAATTLRQVSIAAARSVRCVWAEVR